MHYTCAVIVLNGTIEVVNSGIHLDGRRTVLPPEISAEPDFSESTQQRLPEITAEPDFTPRDRGRAALP